MSQSIYLRPLRIEDAAISYKWRNNAAIWKYTGSRPTCEVTQEMEHEWAIRAIASKERINFAICIKNTNEYIGNIYLVNINNGVGELGIFIGEQNHWGKGYAKEALALFKKIAREEYQIHTIRIGVNPQNIAAWMSYLKNGAIVDDNQWINLSLPTLD
jgi:RimJ/RimL family protein N-acetyltransferase